MAFKRHIHPAEIPPEITATSDLSASAGSVTDEQRIDWLLRECEIRLVDESGAVYGMLLTKRSEIDSEIQAQNKKDG